MCAESFAEHLWLHVVTDGLHRLWFTIGFVPPHPIVTFSLQLATYSMATILRMQLKNLSALYPQGICQWRYRTPPDTRLAQVSASAESVTIKGRIGFIGQ